MILNYLITYFVSDFNVVGCRSIQTSLPISSLPFYLLDWGVFHWTTTPMGNKNSPVLAQRTTDYLSSFIQRCLGYIDDFILYSYILGEILINAEEFLATMSHFNLVLGPKKVNLVSKTQNFLGYSISYNSIIRVTEHKITDLRDIKSPTNKDELKSILGLFAWYAQRSLLRDVTKRMRDMGKSDKRFKFKWVSPIYTVGYCILTELFIQ